MADGPRSLVVGLDGSESALVALDWAAAEAAERNWPLRLVNAFLSRTPEVAYLAQLPTAELGREAAGRIFEAAKRRLAGGGFAELAVSSLAKEGFPRRVLLSEAEQGHGLVVGRRGTGRLADLLLGSTSLACATHSEGTPVIVIPHSWRPRPTGDRRRLVVVGVDGSRRGSPAVEYAFEMAAEWGASLRAVWPVRSKQGGDGRCVRLRSRTEWSSRRRVTTSPRWYRPLRPVIWCPWCGEPWRAGSSRHSPQSQ
jgi:nucleotide-binding universal stress UspA family protein